MGLCPQQKALFHWDDGIWKPSVTVWVSEADRYTDSMWTAERPGHCSMQLIGLSARSLYCGSFKCIVKKSMVMWNVPFVQGRAFSESGLSFRTPTFLLNSIYKPQSQGVCPHWGLCFQLHVVHRVIREDPRFQDPQVLCHFTPCPSILHAYSGRKSRVSKGESRKRWVQAGIRYRSYTTM